MNSELETSRYFFLLFNFLPQAHHLIQMAALGALLRRYMTKDQALESSVLHRYQSVLVRQARYLSVEGECVGHLRPLCVSLRKAEGCCGGHC